MDYLKYIFVSICGIFNYLYCDKYKMLLVEFVDCFTTTLNIFHFIVSGLSVLGINILRETLTMYIIKENKYQERTSEIIQRIKLSTQIQMN